jgi:hypothetical protein
MRNQLDEKDPIGKIIKNVDKMISIFGLLGLAIVAWTFSSFFIEGC